MQILRFDLNPKNEFPWKICDQRDGKNKLQNQKKNPENLASQCV